MLTTNRKVGVGFCTDLAYYNSVPGSRAAKAPSWGLHGDTGKLSTRFDSGHRYKDKSGSSNIKTFGVGDTVGCGIDIPMGLGPAKIFYTLNGKDLGQYKATYSWSTLRILMEFRRCFCRS